MKLVDPGVCHCRGWSSRLPWGARCWSAYTLVDGPGKNIPDGKRAHGHGRRRPPARAPYPDSVQWGAGTAVQEKSPGADLPGLSDNEYLF